MKPTLLRTAASRVAENLRKAGNDRDSEWQRVNSYIADVLKDSHVLYAKLARLQGDFAGSELQELQGISEDVLSLGERLSKFSRAFYEGELAMVESSHKYGEQSPGGEAPAPAPGAPPAGNPAPPPPPAPPPAPEKGEDDEEDEGADYDAKPEKGDDEEEDEESADYDVEVEFVDPKK